MVSSEQKFISIASQYILYENQVGGQRECGDKFVFALLYPKYPIYRSQLIHLTMDIFDAKLRAFSFAELNT